MFHHAQISEFGADRLRHRRAAAKAYRTSRTVRTVRRGTPAGGCAA